MQLVRFITADEHGKATQWCVTDNVKGLMDFMQYVLDSCARPEEYMLLLSSGRCLKAMDIAERIGMRKRSFDESIKNIPTGDAARCEEVMGAYE